MLMRTTAVFLLMIAFGSGAVLAKPALPAQYPQIAQMAYGLFCAITVTGRTAQPQTASGWIHTTVEITDFHWPGQRRVPAVLGLAFGVRAQTVPGLSVADAEMRVYRPGSATPDIWPTGFSDGDPSLAFFRFDTEAELIPGIWVFEAWSGATRLYSVEFEVVTALEGDPIAQACGGTA